MHFLQNKYTKCYYKIIESAKSNNLTKELYTERHHIIPKSLNGTNCKDNIVRLTAREHFICHWLLTKMVDKQFYPKMIYALNGMRRKNKNQQRYETKITSRVYEKTRILCSQEHSKRIVSSETRMKISNSKKGQSHPHSDETKDKISKAHLGKKRDPFTKEHKEKIGKSQIGTKKKPHSQETKDKISASQKGVKRKPMSQESKKKLSESKKGKKIFIDPDTGRRVYNIYHARV